MRFTIKLKLSLAFGLMIVMLVAIAIYGIINLSALNQSASNMVDGPVKRLEYARRFRGKCPNRSVRRKTHFLKRMHRRLPATTRLPTRSRTSCSIWQNLASRSGEKESPAGRP